MLWRDSKATKILSEISLLLVKALWFSVIIFGRILFNLFAKTLEKILYRTLQRLMGRNSEPNFGFFFLGIRAIKFWFKCSGKEAIFRNLRID